VDDDEPIKSDLARIDRMKDEDIDYSDIPELDEEFLTKPTVEWPPASQEGKTRTGADLIAAVQSSPHRDIEIEPEPYFSGEDELSALLLAMVIAHCGAFSPEDQQGGFTSHVNPPQGTEADLESYGNPENAAAMIALKREGLIEISHQDGPRIWAKVTPEGRALLARLSLEQQRKAAASWQHP
jgi:hypothetical protein